MVRWITLALLFLFPTGSFAAHCDTGCITIPLKNGGTEKIPDFCLTATKTSNVTTGNWTAGGTWSGGVAPGATDIVKIMAGHTITMNAAGGTAKNVCVESGGLLTFSTAATTQLTVDTILVKAGGELRIGTAGAPINAANTATITIRNTPPDTNDDAIGVYDPEQWGTGLLATGGSVQMHGVKKTPWCQLSAGPAASATSVACADTDFPDVAMGAAPVGWGAGDLIAIPGTNALAAEAWAADTASPKQPVSPQWETRTISGAVTTLTVNLSTPLTFAHAGGMNDAGTVVFLPHVMNLSRNVIIRSASPTGTRGHTAFFGRANVDMRYVEFQDLGRTTIEPLDSTIFTCGFASSVGTNQIGKYPIHMHHLMGPVTPQANGQQYTLIGNSINNDAGGRIDEKWGITIHNAHWGLVQGNVIWNTPGAAVMAEDGSEYQNTIEYNFAARVPGDNAREDGRCGGDCGHDGSAYWFRAFANRVRHNIAANMTRYGFLWQAGLLASPVRRPTAPGDDSATTFTDMNPHAQDFGAGIAGGQGNYQNIAYAGNRCFTYWSAGSNGFENQQITNPNRITADGQVCWGIAKATIMYQVANLDMNNFTILCNKATHGNQTIQTFEFGDYTSIDTTVSNLTMENCGRAAFVPPAGGMRGYSDPANLQVLKNSTLKNCVNVRKRVLFHNNSTTNYQAQRLEIRDSTLAAPTATACSQRFDILMEGNTNPSSNEEVTQENSIFLTNYNATTNDYQVFFKESADLAIMPTSTFSGTNTRLIACPLPAGRTNDQCNATDGVRFAKADPTCADDTTFPLIFGFTCASGIVEPPPPGNFNPPTAVSIGAAP